MDSIYIKAMEIGHKNPNGISYFDLKKEIEKEIIFSNDQGSELTFIEWFIEYFYQPDQELEKNILFIARNHFSGNYNNSYESKFKKKLGAKFYIKGLTMKYYLDFQELKEARENSQRAFDLSNTSNDISRESLRISNRSFWVAVAAFVLPTLLSLILHFYKEKPATPPFDVKIIEDRTSTIQLEKENKKLKEQLFEAERLIETSKEKSK